MFRKKFTNDTCLGDNVRQLKLTPNNLIGKLQQELRVVRSEKETQRIPSMRFPEQKPLADLKLLALTISC